MGKMMDNYAGKIISAFLDAEEATTKIRLKNLGVRYPTKLLNDITVEKVFKFIEGVSIFKQEKDIVDIPSMVIWDSIANTSSQKERETEDINSVIGYKARLLSMLLPKYIAKAAKNNICIIAVNQMRELLALGQFAPPKDLKFMTHSKDVPGGQALKYNAFHLLEMKVGQVLTQDKYGFDGVKTKVKCVKNKLFQPNIEIEILGSFNSGFSNFWTNYNFLAETKRLNTGAWNYLVSYSEKKFRTKDALNLYKTDESFRMEFDKAAKEAIQTDIIDKYSLEI
jgi:RecA/RadA recombinase